MKVNMYSIYDVKSECYDMPAFMRDDNAAERHFKMVVTNPDSMICKFKDEYEIYRLGQFDMNTGFFIQDIKLVLQGKQIKIGEK